MVVVALSGIAILSADGMSDGACLALFLFDGDDDDGDDDVFVDVDSGGESDLFLFLWFNPGIVETGSKIND